MVEMEYIFDFKLLEIYENNSDYIIISGLIGHSSYNYKAVEIINNNEKKNILIYAEPSVINKDGSGSFEIKLLVEQNIDKIYFGNKNIIIWERNTIEKLNNIDINVIKNTPIIISGYSLFHDDKYIVFNGWNHLLKCVYKKKDTIDISDYINENPIFVSDDIDLQYIPKYRYLINDILIFTYGTTTDPLSVRFINLLDGTDMLTDVFNRFEYEYFLKEPYFRDESIILKELGCRSVLDDKQLKYIDIEIENRLKKKRIEWNRTDELMYYEALSFDFKTHEIKEINKIIPFLLQ